MTRRPRSSIVLSFGGHLSFLILSPFHLHTLTITTFSSSLVLCLFRQVRDSNGTILLCSSPSLSLRYCRDLCSSSTPTSLFSVFLEPFFPFIRPSKTVLSSESLRNTCPIQFFCLLLIMLTSVRSSSTAFSTSSFVLCSVQLICRSLLQIHISNASSLLTSSFVIVHVSEPYNTTLHMSAFTIRIFKSSFSFPLNNSPLLVNLSFPIAILRFISVMHLQSSVIRLPR